MPVLALWAAAPLIAFALSRPVPTRRAVLGAEDREFLAVGRAQDLALLRDVRRTPRITRCRPTTSRSCPELTVAHRTSPTNIGMACSRRSPPTTSASSTPTSWSTRIDATLTTVESLERFEGHLLNWYDTRTLAPLPPAYVSTVDSGNLAGALLTLSVGAAAAGRAASRRTPRRCAATSTSWPRAPSRCSTAMNFRFLYDPQRQLFAIGYRLADAEGPGRLDPSYYDLLASEARLASFLAIAKGDVPESHWFHLGRPSPASTARRCCCRGAPRCSST